MWFVGSRGDFGSLVEPAAGPGWLRGHDPESFALLTAVYGGKASPEPVFWSQLPAATSDRSGRGHPTRVLFVNRGDRPVDRFWVDYSGTPRSYGTIAPGAAVLQHTYATHVWRLERGGHVVAEVAAAALPGRVELGRSVG